MRCAKPFPDEFPMGGPAFVRFCRTPGTSPDGFPKPPGIGRTANPIVSCSGPGRSAELSRRDPFFPFHKPGIPSFAKLPHLIGRLGQDLELARKRQPAEWEGTIRSQ